MKESLGNRVAFDFTLNEIEWELNEENIEEYYEEIDNYGVIVIRAFDEDGDFITRVIAGDISDGLYDAMSEVEDVIDEYPDVKAIYPIHMNPVVRETAQAVFGDDDRIRIIEPLEVVDFHNYLNHSYMILTDSGGIQEEAPSYHHCRLISCRSSGQEHLQLV